MIHELNLSEVEIAGDNRLAIMPSVSENDPPWDCAVIFHDIRELAARHGLSFCWYPGQANGTAHWTARTGLRDLLPANWAVNPPVALQRALYVVSY
ncbi:hypothetical protein ACSBR2_042820 [Camellia fascicularis]